jgi:serine/threonine protein kinase
MKFENESMGDDPMSKYKVMLTGDQCLGKGAYGYVTLVEEKNSKQLFAMKVIDKKFVEANGGKILLDREVSIHKGLNHPNIIKLYDFFENEKKVHPQNFPESKFRYFL